MLAISAPASAHPHHPAFVRNDTIIAETKAETKARRELERQRAWRREFKPFIYPDGRRWAVPYPIAWCESGGDYFVGPYGAYGLIMEAQWLPPRTQDEIAHRLYEEQGEGPWAPYESGCAYR